MTNQECLLCHKELPGSYRVPVCKNCRGKISDGAKKAGSLAAGTAVTIGAVVVSGGADKLRKYGPEAVKVISAVVKKL